MNIIWVGLKYYILSSINYFYYYLLLPLVLSHTAIMCIHNVFHPFFIFCGLVRVPICFEVATISLLVSTSMCKETFVKMFRYWVTRLFLERSDGRSRGYVDILYATFPTVSGKQYHQLLVLRNNLLQNFCNFCCNWWCWIFGGHCLPYFPGVEIWQRG